MPKNLLLAASLPALPDQLFDMYLDPAIHTAFTGFQVTIESRAGASLSCVRRRTFRYHSSL